VWIWATSATSELGPTGRSFIAKASDEGALSISAMSVWEVSLLEQTGRLGLQTPIEAWLHTATVEAQIRVVSVDASIALNANRLPGDFHRDPADRLIVSTARTIGALLVTRDQKILDYGKSGYVDVMAA
jgi:PIN domain nuclease of toxin-antitoxin system